MKLVLCMHLMFLDEDFYFSKLLKTSILLFLWYGCFSLNLLGFLNAFSLLLSFVSDSDLTDRCVMSPALFFRSFANRQPCCPALGFQMYHAVKLLWVNRKPSQHAFQSLKMPRYMRFEDSSKLSRACVCVDLLMDFLGFQQRGREISWGEKVLDQVYIQTFSDLQVLEFLRWKYTHKWVLMSARQGLFLSS